MKRKPLLALTLAAIIAASGPLRASEEAQHESGHGPAAPKDAHDPKAKGKEAEQHPTAAEKQAAREKCYEFLMYDAGAAPAHAAHSPHGDAAEKPPGGEAAEKHEGADPQKPPEHTQAMGDPHPEAPAAGEASPAPTEAAGAASPNPEVGPHARPPAEAPAMPAMPALDDFVEQPYRLIRTLEALQDKIATGNREAHVYQRTLLSTIARKLPKVSDADWRKPRNSRAGIVYALSGGDPSVLAKLLSLSPLPCIDEKLIKGLLDYSQGQNDSAWKLLGDIDPRELDPRAAGHLALAQAMLIAGIEPQKAIKFLDLARIIAPGTLVEEAALRREAVIAASIEDFQTFQMLTSQYLRRFSNSVYASDFVRRFATAVTTSKYSDDDTLFQELIEVLDRLAPEARQSAYLALAKSGVFRGRVSVALTSARKLAAFSASDPQMLVRAKLYEVAAQLVTTEYDQAVDMLKTIDRAALPARERPLFDAVSKLAERLHLPLQVTLPMAEPPPVSAEQGPNAELQKLPRIFDDAKAALGKADELMKGDKQ